MRSFFKSFFLLILFGFCCCSFFGCEAEEKIVKDESKLQVYTSFYCVYDFVSKIGGDKVQVYNLVPNGTEPHNWEPTAGDILGLKNADVFFYNGGGMESWTDKVMDLVKGENVRCVCLSEGIELIGGDEGADPHIWLDPKNAQKEAEIIKTALIMADPNNEDYYNQKYKDFSDKISKLDSDFKAAVLDKKDKTIVVAHQAYGYLCKAYGLRQLAIEGLSADSEPSPAKMAEISEFVKNNNVKVIFFEELLATKAASVISEETGAKLLVLNPFEGLTQQEADNGDDYFSIMRKNLENIKQALYSQ